MDPEYIDLINEAILVELNVAELYLLFYRQYPGDAPFWWQLSMEEQNHAALLKTVRKMEVRNVNIPQTMFPGGVSELKRTNQWIRSAIEEFEQSPDRDRAFRTAYHIEISAGELHYDKFMKENPGSPVEEILRKLNGADLDHAQRISRYMEEHQILPE